MKRIFITLLTAIVVISAFPATAMASWPTQPGKPTPDGTPTPDPAQVESYTPYRMTSTDVLDDKFINPFTPIVVGREQNTLIVPIKDAFERPLVHGDDRAQLTINDLQVEFDGGINFRRLFAPHHTAIWYPDMDHAQFELAPQNIGLVKGKMRVVSRYWGTASDWVDFDGRFVDPTINKDIIALSGQNLAENGGIDTGYADYNEPRGQVMLNGYDYAEATLVETKDKLNDMGVILSGSDLMFRLDTEHFLWDPDILDMITAVRAATMHNNRIGVFAQYYEGRTTIEEIVIENVDGRAYVIVRFRDDFPFLDERDFYLDLYLTYHGAKHNGTMVSIGGSIENDILYVYGDDEIADISDGGLMIEAVGACRNTEIQAGSGVSIFANLVGGKRYYARATDAREAGDIEIMDYFPDIMKAFTITSAQNIPNDATVTFNYEEYDDDGAEVAERDRKVYYVYDSNGDLIGTSDHPLPIRKKYYLAARQLNFDDGSFEVVYAGHGGWDTPSSNKNHNPGTGRIA